MRILSIQQVALTTNPDGTEVPLVFENGVFYKIFGNGFESAPFNHDSDNVNFLPVGQGYPTPMLGVITNGTLKLYTTYAPVDYVQLLEFTDDTYVSREEVRETIIDMADVTEMVVQLTGYTDKPQVTLSVQSVALDDAGMLTIECLIDRQISESGTYAGLGIYVESYGRRYYPIRLQTGSIFDSGIQFVINGSTATFSVARLGRFQRVVTHNDYA